MGSRVRWLWVELPEGFLPRPNLTEAVNRWLVERGYEAPGKYPLVSYAESKRIASVWARKDEEPSGKRSV